MSKCGMCGKETKHKSTFFKYCDITDCDTNEKIECLCKDCEDFLCNYFKNYSFERSEE